MTNTSSQAKRAVSRALRTTIDPELKPKEKDAIWNYFDSCCAYCGVPLDRSKTQGDMDHLVSGGTNHISNRVLSCKPCNQHEKRGLNWDDFLVKKYSDSPDLQSQRQEKIVQWTKQNGSFHLSEVQQKALDDEAEFMHREIERAIKRLRELKNKVKNNAAMKGKATFTRQEADEIIDLIRQKVVATTNKQKTFRAKIRKIDFYAEDFDLYGGYTEQDFIEAVHILPDPQTHNP